MTTTKVDLDQLVQVLNNRLGRPHYEWYRSPAGPNVCRVGALTLDWSYGRPRLHQVVNSSGGVSEIGPRLAKPQMAVQLRAILIGIDFAETNLRTAAPELDGLPGWGEFPSHIGLPPNMTPDEAYIAGVADGEVSKATEGLTPR